MENMIPDSWAEVNLSDFAVNGGLFSDGSWIESKDQDPNGEIRLIQLADIGVCEFKDRSDRYMSSSKADELKCTFLKKGDILIARMPDPIGRACIFPFDGKYVTVVDIAFLRTNLSFVDNSLIVYFINSPQFLEQVNLLSSGTTRQRISRKNLEAIPFPLPPFREQKRIVDKLDSLFRQFKDLKEKIESLKNIGGKYLNSCIINIAENSFYTRKKIGEFLEEGNERIGDKWEGMRLIGVSAKEGITDLRIGQKQTFEKYKVVRPGDIIYNTMRVNIGSIAIYDGEDLALTSPDYVVFRVKKFLSPQLLLKFLKSDQGLLEIGSNTKGSVRARLYFSALSEVRMPIAPESIQLSAEKFLSGFDHALKRIIQLQRNQLEKLPKVILDKAFKGKLVEQLSTDSDANELLKKIQKLKIDVAKKTVPQTKPNTEKTPAKIKAKTFIKPAIKPTIELEEPKGVEANFMWHYLRSSFGAEKFTVDQVELPMRYTYDKLKEEFFELLDECRELEKGARLVQMYNGSQISYQIKLK